MGGHLFKILFLEEPSVELKGLHTKFELKGQHHFELKRPAHHCELKGLNTKF